MTQKRAVWLPWHFPSLCHCNRSVLYSYLFCIYLLKLDLIGFHNVSKSWNVVQTRQILKSGVDAATFQWTSQYLGYLGLQLCKGCKNADDLKLIDFWRRLQSANWCGFNSVCNIGCEIVFDNLKYWERTWLSSCELPSCMSFNHKIWLTINTHYAQGL